MTSSAPNVLTLCVDTNLLVEFVSLVDIPWRTLDAAVDVVRIIVPTKVGQEMDSHKTKSGRLRRRAIEFSQTSQRMESSPDGCVVLRNSDPKVTIEFGPLFRLSQLDGDQFDLDDPDNRIVAEVLAIKLSVPETAFLTDDSLPRRLARQAGITVIRPESSWRRPEGPHERDVEVAELKRELGARPELRIHIPKIDEKEFIAVHGKSDSIEQVCADLFEEAVLELNPKVSRSSLIERHGYDAPARQSFYNLPIGPLGYFREGLSDAQLEQYESEYKAFVRKTKTVASNLHEFFACFRHATYLNIDVSNEGDRFAERVLVEAEIAGNFGFLPSNTILNLLDKSLEVPEPPEPTSLLPPIDSPRFNSKAALTTRRVDIFHEHDVPDSSRNTKRVSWRCEEFRQDAKFSLGVLIVSNDPAATGQLKVSVNSAVLAKKEQQSIPLRSQKLLLPAGPNYFLNQLSNVPKSYRALFKSKLEAHLAMKMTPYPAQVVCSPTYPLPDNTFPSVRTKSVRHCVGRNCFKSPTGCLQRD